MSTEATAPSAGNEAAADQASFESALAAAMAVTNAAPDGRATAPAAVVTPPAPAEAAVPSTPVSVTNGQPAQPDNAPAPPSAKELERIAAFEAREAKIRAAEDRVAAIDSREAALKARETTQWDAFVRDPVGHVRRMRPDLNAAEAAQVAEKFYFDALGDKAPPEHRQRQEVAKVTTEVRTEVDQLRTELQELRDARAREVQQSQLSTYRSELRTGVDTVTDAPLVKSLAARHPARAEEMLFEVARRAAIESRESGATEPVVLTAAQAAAKLESILKAQRDELFGPAEVPAPQATKTVAGPTITNRDASIQPPRTTPDPNDDRTLRRAALDAAGLSHIAVWD